VKIQAAYLHGPSVSHSFHLSMLGVLRDGAVTGVTAIPTASGDIAPNRNGAVAQFLDNTDADALWFVDTDMGFAADTVRRLAALEMPVAGALCFSWRGVSSDGMGGMRCKASATIFWRDGADGFKRAGTYAKDAILPVAATGTGCLLIRREVLEKVRADFGDQWFSYLPGLSEDLSFMRRLGELDIPVVVHTGIKTTHHKSVWVGEADLG
jgi:hypothetical protein